MWQCDYCGRLNSGLNSCDGCGGPPTDVHVNHVQWQMGTGALPDSWNDPRKDVEACKILNKPTLPPNVSIRG